MNIPVLRGTRQSVFRDLRWGLIMVRLMIVMTTTKPPVNQGGNSNRESIPSSVHRHRNRPPANSGFGGFGDAGERNVKITRGFRSLAILICALTLVGEWVATRTTSAAPLDHFAWNTVASPQTAGAPFSAA